MADIYTGNDFLVGVLLVGGDDIVIRRPAVGTLSREGALALAAWLVALADPTGEEFPAVLAAVQST